MEVDDLVQLVSQSIFVLLFLVSASQAVRRPTRVTVDAALFFGTIALAIGVGRVASALGLSGPLLSALSGSLLMALPYFLVRLVDDFAGLPRGLLRGAAVGLVVAIVSLLGFPPPYPLWLAVLLVAYFSGLSLYAGVSTVRLARSSSGLTRRRMEAAGVGTLLLGSVILLAGLGAAVAPAAQVLALLGRFLALGAGLAYFVGFAPPRWLRRAWQEPALRAFLARGTRALGMPSMHAILQELEQGAASSLGAQRAAIGCGTRRPRCCASSGTVGSWMCRPAR